MAARLQAATPSFLRNGVTDADSANNEYNLEVNTMSPGGRSVLIPLVMVVLSFSAAARGDLVVDFMANDADGMPITGPVAAGTSVSIDVLLSVTGIDNPLSDVRLIQFDFKATSATISLDTFAWMIQPGINDAAYFQLPILPTPSAVYLQTAAVEGLILNLSATPVRVAVLGATINGNGTLSVQAPSETDPSSGTVVTAGFEEPRSFSSGDGNLSGGVLTFTVASQPGQPTPGDADGDGTPDEADAFPDDPNEQTDSDGNGIGDNQDPVNDDDGVPDDGDSTPTDPDQNGGQTGSGDGGSDDDPGADGTSGSGGSGGRVSLCGLGMLGPCVVVFMILTLTRLERAGRRR